MLQSGTMIITSPHNPRVKYVLALRDRRQRNRDGLMAVEGHDELMLALACGARPKTLFYCRSLIGEIRAESVLDRVRESGAEILEVNVRVFEKMAYRENPDGWLAVVPIPQRTLDELKLSPAPAVMVMESVEKPGNLGAILRSADAAGCEAVILCDPAADIGNPNVVRASRGTVFAVPVAVARSQEALDWLHARGIRVVAATPDASAPYTEVDLRAPVAVAVGTERTGLSDIWRRGADIQARIPMKGRIRSLNVAAAATLFLFEIARQRAP